MIPANSGGYGAHTAPQCGRHVGLTARGGFVQRSPAGKATQFPDKARETAPGVAVRLAA
jgi:hypothetical protein